MLRGDRRRHAPHNFLVQPGRVSRAARPALSHVRLPAHLFRRSGLGKERLAELATDFTDSTDQLKKHEPRIFADNADQK